MGHFFLFNISKAVDAVKVTITISFLFTGPNNVAIITTAPILLILPNNVAIITTVPILLIFSTCGPGLLIAICAKFKHYVQWASVL